MSNEPDDEVRLSQANAAVLSLELRTFYQSHNINVSELLDEGRIAWRFIRMNPRYVQSEILSSFPVAHRVPWLHPRFGFVAIPSSIHLKQLETFRSGRVYGMDPSSGVAVAVLLTSEYDVEPCQDDRPGPVRVLDLCCAPGLKLCMISDLISESNPGSTVVGVDVSNTRLSSCKAIVKKYQVDPSTSGRKSNDCESIRILLYCEDGVTFGSKSANCVFDSHVAFEEQRTAGKRKRVNKSARRREQKQLMMLHPSEPSNSINIPRIQLFDRVLVDAECSTDGSIKHVLQQMKRAKDAVLENEQLTNESTLEELVQLQKGLIASGYRLLKPGGLLVYSTCSLSKAQNEGVVQWLLDNESDAYLVPLEFGINDPCILDGSIPGSIRFLPSSTNFFTGCGFFLAKVGKNVSKRMTSPASDL